MIMLVDNSNGKNWCIDKGCTIIEGENGAGKSTLLDIVSGLVKEQNLEIEGNKSLVYMNQSMFFFDRLKVKDFVKFFYQLDGIKRHREYIENFNDKLGNILDIQGLWDKQVGYLSGGEKKLVYFYIIMSLEREWYLLDEPFAGVDKNRKEIMKKVINVKLKEDKGIILVTHEDDNADCFINYKVCKIQNIPISWKYKLV
ncbi:MAG TPA: ATP-binding cassette domain-containing protein [Candidatus Pelethocola excrementipullorum]|nr:ATP-binding cassette domain-containing protein [Candidatus Pelethocola excrementipullorum]